jgi:hypothetical protein
MTPKEKYYHIYAKDRCLFHSLKEDDFNIKWDTLNHLVGLMKTEYSKEDLSFIGFHLKSMEQGIILRATWV